MWTLTNVFLPRGSYRSGSSWRMTRPLCKVTIAPSGQDDLVVEQMKHRRCKNRENQTWIWLIDQPEEVGGVGRRRTLVLRGAVATPHLHIMALVMTAMVTIVAMVVDLWWQFVKNIFTFEAPRGGAAWTKETRERERRTSRTTATDLESNFLRIRF